MPELHAQRTLVKSRPELWAELSDPSSLARHLAEFGEISITRKEPETIVAWEGERARGTVELCAAGSGTRVTLTALLADGDEEPPEPEAAPEEPATPEPPRLVPVPSPLRAVPPLPPDDDPPAPDEPDEQDEPEEAPEVLPPPPDISPSDTPDAAEVVTVPSFGEPPKPITSEPPAPASSASPTLSAPPQFGRRGFLRRFLRRLAPTPAPQLPQFAVGESKPEPAPMPPAEPVATVEQVEMLEPVANVAPIAKVEHVETVEPTANVESIAKVEPVAEVEPRAATIPTRPEPTADAEPVAPKPILPVVPRESEVPPEAPAEQPAPSVASATDRGTAVLEEMLSVLGAAHHRPFSRG